MQPIENPEGGEPSGLDSKGSQASSMNTIVHYFPEFVNSTFFLESRPQIIGYCRVSTTEQAWRLPHQIEQLRGDIAWELCIGLRWEGQIFSEIHSGTTFDRPQFQACTAYAEATEAVIVAPDINRFVRHERYCPAKSRTMPATQEQTEELLSYGVIFATIQGFDQSLIRSAETRRGLREGRAGGRPRGLTKQQELEIILRREQGYSYREIAETVGCSLGAVQRTLR